VSARQKRPAPRQKAGSDPGTLSPLAAAFQSLATRRILLFGGKGGVGKTTLSLAAALWFARSRRVRLFTTDPASSLTDLVPDPTAFPNLAIEALDAERLYAAFLKTNLPGFLELGDRGTYLERGELQRFFELSLPGVDELMAWSRIGELAEQSDDLLIVDTAPTGHTLRMLASAGHSHQIAEALDSMQAKHRGMMRQFMGRNVRDAMDQFLEDFAAQSQRRRERLSDPAVSAFIPVTLSEPWVLEQTVRLIDEVRGDGIDVPFAILNRAVVMPPDCDDDRIRATRDDAARKQLAPLTTVDAPRACVPLDEPARIRDWTSGMALPMLVSPAPTPEPSHSTPTLDLQAARLIFFAGKGGVGKTTSASSIALQLAARSPERSFTILSVDPAHSLRDVFASQAAPANLRVEIIDTRERWQRLRDSIGEEIERAVAALTPGNFSVAYDTEAMKKLIEIAPPGADEIFAITRLSDLVSDPRNRPSSSIPRRPGTSSGFSTSRRRRASGSASSCAFCCATGS
jgi:Oxyanion-translocating ATPase